MIAMFMTGCSGFSIRPIMGGVWLSDPVITSGLDQNGDPVDNIKVFNKGVSLVYCYMSIKGSDDFRISVRWYHEDVLVFEQFLDFGTHRKVAALLNYHNGEPLPSGDYRCEYGYLPEKPLRSVSFRIEA